MISLRAVTFCWRNGIIADSSLRTVTGVAMLYSKRSAISVADPEETSMVLDWANVAGGAANWPPRRSTPPPTPPPLPGLPFAAALARAFDSGVTDPLYTVGAIAWSSANSAPSLVMNFGGYNWLINEIGFPETRDRRTF